MAFCGKCGAEIIEGNEFCTNCGSPVATIKNKETSPPAKETPSEEAAKKSEAAQSTENTATKEEALKKYESQIKRDEVEQEKIEEMKKRKNEYKDYVTISAVMSVVLITAWFIFLCTVTISYTVDMGPIGTYHGSATLWEIMTNSDYKGAAPIVLWVATVVSVLFTIFGTLGPLFFAISNIATFISLFIGLKIAGSVFGISQMVDAHVSFTFGLLLLFIGMIVLALVSLIPMIVYERKIVKGIDSIFCVSKAVSLKEEIFCNILLLFK